jgi:hypothetical protein
MEGAALREEREHDRAIAQAWHTAMFGLNGYGGKLKGKTLSDYLINKPKPKQSSAAKAIAFFHSMKSAGFDVKIERVERSDGR